MSEWPDFEIPETWSLTPIEELAETLRAGGTPSRKNKAYFGGDIPFAIIEDITGCGTYLDSTKQAITREGLEASSAWIVPEGSVLLSMYATIGATAINKIPVATNQAILAIVPKETCNPEFLCYCLQAHKRHLTQLNVESTQKNVNKGIVSSFRLPLPPLQEQKSIAYILLAVQRAIEAQKRIIQTTTELKQALMQKLFSEGLRGEPQKETEIGLVPESWEVVPLSEICQFLSGGTPSKQNPEFWQGSIPWVSPKDMKRPRLQDAQDHISQEGLESGSKLAPAGSVLVVVRGMILAKTVPVALAEVPVAINQDMKAIIPGPKLSSDYLLYALEAFRENLFKRVGRSGHGTCTLMGHEVAAFKIPFPSLQEQIRIATAAANLDCKIELHQSKHEHLKSAFNSLLHELMTSKTRVHELKPSETAS